MCVSIQGWIQVISVCFVQIAFQDCFQKVYNQKNESLTGYLPKTLSLSLSLSLSLFYLSLFSLELTVSLCSMMNVLTLIL